MPDYLKTYDRFLIAELINRKKNVNNSVAFHSFLNRATAFNCSDFFLIGPLQISFAGTAFCINKTALNNKLVTRPRHIPNSFDRWGCSHLFSLLIVPNVLSF